MSTNINESFNKCLYNHFNVYRVILESTN